MYQATINQNTKLSFSEPSLLSDLLCRTGEYLSMPCGGKGTCGNCKVAAQGALSPVTEEEQKHLTQAELEQGIRLACKAYAIGDVTITATAVPMEIAIDSSLGDSFLPEDNTDGVVIDIGTTTVAAIQYRNRQPVKTITQANYQATCGADVISRISFEEEHPGLASQLLRRQVGEILSAFEHPQNTVIVANTAMLHFLTGQSVLSMGKAPYTTADLFGKEYTVSDFPCYLSPCISAFVGGDITAGILATRMTEQKERSMLLDLGTNGEIAYFDGNRLFAASTAAGPAFEGATIFMGMPAQPGAVDRVWIENGVVRYTTVGNTIAKGICGSGLVDLLAVMLECGAMEDSGSLNPDHPLCKPDHHGKICFALPESNVILRASDVRKLQLAKGAIRAGMLTLAETVDTLYIAGGFGSYLNPENAQKIGLLPKKFCKRIESVGNAALSGGKLMTFSLKAREKALSIATGCNMLDLSQNPIFTQHYIDSMQF